MARVYNVRKKGQVPIPESAVYVGRPTKWGNPFRVSVDGSRDQVIEMYRAWVKKNTRLSEEIRRELKGKDLVCWCAPKPCHADVLLEVANEGQS